MLSIIVFIEIFSIVERRKELTNIRLENSRYLSRIDNKLDRIVLVDKGFSSSASYTIRLLNYLIVVRRRGLLIA